LKRLILVLVCALAASASFTSAANPASRCNRTVGVPSHVFAHDPYEPDAAPELIHATASAMYCPSNVWVQIRACIQRQAVGGWSTLGCRRSARTYVSRFTRGGRGVGLTFDVPCVSGMVRTRVRGGEGLTPSTWVSRSAKIRCLTGR
jgi:hypothetical protein